jgi:hypothetical protein
VHGNEYYEMKKREKLSLPLELRKRRTGNAKKARRNSSSDDGDVKFTLQNGIA